MASDSSPGSARAVTQLLILVIINKQLLDEVSVICRIINVEVRIISRAEGEADNSYRDIDNFAYHKNRIQQLFYYTFQVEKTIN